MLDTSTQQEEFINFVRKTKNKSVTVNLLESAFEKETISLIQYHLAHGNIRFDSKNQIVTAR